MNTKFVYDIETSCVGTDELVISALDVDERRIALTGAVIQIERFGLTAEEIAIFAGSADSVHFVREFVYVPVCGTGLNDKTLTEEIAVLTAIAVEDEEPIKKAQISRVVCRW